jgi:hypothetical protein
VKLEAVTAMDTTDAHLVDSGADGAFSAALSQYNPAHTGAVVDFVQVITGVNEAAVAHGRYSRTTGIVGNLLK